MKRTTTSSSRMGGFTLVESVVVLGTATLAILGIIASHVTIARLNRVTRETTLATEAMRSRMEQIAACDPDLVVATYNVSTSDDPTGSGTSPGATYTVAGLDADSAARRGTIEMPLDGSGNLREDVTNTDLGMPRDLNGDGVVDALDHRSDYRILPVLVRMRWKGVSGDREMRVATVFLR